jgi:transcriptional regulator with XRE-family HTH domain
MTEQENLIINSIANKLEIVLNKNRITILALSKLLNIDKQPVYRIMKREHIPNISFLEMIANYLNCSILELIDERFFLDINTYYNYNINDQNELKHEKYRIYIYDKSFISIANNEFFGIIENSFIKIFYRVNNILDDGYYLMLDNNNTIEINIIGVGKNLIIALVNDKEIRINPNNIIVTAKLYKTISIIQFNEYAIKLT